jgi:hypothetical protein
LRAFRKSDEICLFGKEEAFRMGASVADGVRKAVARRVREQRLVDAIIDTDKVAQELAVSLGDLSPGLARLQELVEEECVKTSFMGAKLSPRRGKRPA